MITLLFEEALVQVFPKYTKQIVHKLDSFLKIEKKSLKICINSNIILPYKINLLTFLKQTCSIMLNLPVLVGPLSAIQPFSHSLTITFPGHWTTSGN